MANARDIKRRINVVKNTKKITKAMEMVAAAKLRRAQERAVAARPYSSKLVTALRGLAEAKGTDVSHPLLQHPQGGAVVYCLVTADRGLAGGYNANLLRTAGRAMADHEGPVGLVAVGRKGLDYFRRRGVEINASFVNWGEEARFSLAEEIAETLMGLFVEGKVREVRLIYSEFHSALSQRPVETQLLPIASPKREEKGGESAEDGDGVERSTASYIFIPSAAELIAELLPKLVKNSVYQALLEAKAGEHAARMTAMRSATDNAQELIEDLTLEYNRVRQAAITTEISEIVGGAEALKA